MAGDVPSPSRGAGSAEPAEPGVAAAPLALYRRYRPATFAEVKGQEHVTEPLRQALRSGRVHHAYLFSGPRGCGKTSSARILARSLNCESGPTPDPCGVCASCVALAPTGPGSIDVIEIDAASHGGVDDARDLRERAFYAPVSARYKIYIIDEAHMVTGGGFNALLKLVEEPPPHLKFVFATTEPEKVISTIRSRTHHYPFRLVPPAVLRELLEEILASEKVSYDPAVLPMVIRAGAGSVRDSLSVLDQLIAGSDETGLRYERTAALLGYTDDSLLDEVTESFAAGDGAAVFHAIDRVVEGGHDPRRFAADLLDRLRDLIILAAVPDAAASGLLDAPADRLARMAEQAARFGQARLAGAAETVSAGLVEMRGATSPRLQLELICAQVLLPPPGSGERSMLARLERLERQLEGGPLASPGRGAEGRRPSSATAAAERPSATAGPEHPHAAEAERPASAEGGHRQAAGPGHPQSTTGSARSSAAAGVSPVSAQFDASARHGIGDQAAADAGRPERPSGSAAAGRPAAETRGAASAEQIRERWDAVLEAVRDRSKVAWVQLNNATVDSLADGILVLRFGREGEARAFSARGHDQHLGQVLQAMFGIAPQIKAVFGAMRGPEPGASRPARQTAPDRPAGQPQTPAGPAPRRGTSGAGSPARGTAGGQEPSSGAAGQGQSPAGGATADHPRPSGPGPAGAAAGAGTAGAPEWSLPPDDFGEAGADALTGMDLIERELGGRMIEEFGEP